MDLSLIPIDQLIAELDKRIDSSILLTHRFTNNEDVYDWHIHGNKLTVLGMIQIADKHIKDLYDSNETGEFFKD